MTRWTKEDMERISEQLKVMLPLHTEVDKHTGAYTGPGVIRGYAWANNGTDLRYIVAHKIDGGAGELLHIYSPNQIRERSNG